MKALVFKELREVFGIAAAALACYLALVASLVGARVFDWIPEMPNGTVGVPFLNPGFGPFFILVSVVFAAALGFRQSAVESARGTFLYLLHRPPAREAIFLTKLATGMGVFLACASVPIVLYGCWAATPGTHPSPFSWSMTGSTWQFTFLAPLLYLGAFLSGLRPGWWFGTRLLPLAAALTCLSVLYALPGWWLVGLPLAALLYGLLVANICFVARERDYA